ncbi:DNA-binding protein [Rhodococcus sp. MSC1_016]|uniref:DNA-binding protein n=1 Tax=Rhodococcus sp. MSC1_016 TaxID=2909266 RepID=UPI002030C6AA|nr:DNA-binding protein [Rhodococcus sp. MSC1_016]
MTGKATKELDVNREEFETLGVATDLRTANRALGIGDSTGYALASKGEYPVPVIRAGSRYIVPTKGLREALGIGAA